MLIHTIRFPARNVPTRHVGNTAHVSPCVLTSCTIMAVTLAKVRNIYSSKTVSVTPFAQRYGLNNMALRFSVLYYAHTQTFNEMHSLIYECKQALHLTWKDYVPSLYYSQVAFSYLAGSYHHHHQFKTVMKGGSVNCWCGV